MCVIMIANKVRPTEEMIRRAWESNKDGGGIAWREGDEVYWKKGIDTVEQMIEFMREAPTPYVAHFRVASIGGVKPALTHPFPISPTVSVALQGRTKGAVLFHNGHWSMWNDKALDAAVHSNQKLPVGRDWSDTRAMAWMVNIYGPELLELLPSQKAVIFSADDMQIFTGGGWDKINDVWCSNDYFWKGRTGGYHSHGPSSYYRLCHVGKCTNRAQQGKDLCEKCERERNPSPQADSSSKDDTKEDHTAAQTTALTIVRGGKRPVVQLFSLSEIDKIYKANGMSKSKMKKYKKLYQILGKGGNREARAKRALQVLSEEIAERLVHG